MNNSNKKGIILSYSGKQVKQNKIKLTPSLVTNKKLKLISKKEGKLLIEADEKFFINMLNIIQSFSADLNECLQIPNESQQQVNQSESEIQQDFQVLNEEENSFSSQSEDKSKTPQQQANQQSSGVRDTQDFYRQQISQIVRRIPHFFMGRFKKWAKILQEQEVCDYLHKLRSNKKSKQGRYELGDFHKCFQIDKNDAQDVQKSKKKIKELFLEFLQNEAVLQIIQYNKITSQEQKVKYIDVIPNMVQEMYSDKPFDQFLAQANIEKQILKKKQLVPEPGIIINVENQVKTEDPPKLDIFRGESFKSQFDH